MKQHTFSTLVLGTALLFGIAAFAAENDRPRMDSADYAADQRIERQNREIQGQATDGEKIAETSKTETRSVMREAAVGSAQEMIRRKMEAL